MTAHDLVFQSRVPVSAEAVLDWHGHEGSFTRLTPAWGRIRVVNTRGTIAPGDGKDLRASLGPFWFTWAIVHHVLDRGVGFRDVQTRGPFSSWTHEHEFIRETSDSSIVEDRITYTLPAGSLGDRLANRRIERKLDDVFRFRHQRLHSDLSFQRRYATMRPLRVAITGASGFVGTQLMAFLSSAGHDVVRLVRRTTASERDIYWDPESGEIERTKLEGLDAVVHLAGVSIAGGRWSEKRKQAIRGSRIASTSLLASTLASLRNPPRVLVSTSAVGYYGNAPGKLLTEDDPAGAGFLSEVCRQWEAAADPARAAGIRVVHPRFGVVLSGEGGMLPLLARAFSLGVGGPIGSGQQHMSWIALDDLLGVLLEVIRNDRLDGPVNATSPQLVTNAEFTRTLAHVVRRPAFMRVPGPLLHAVAGDLADELLLADQAATSRKLEHVRLPFQWPSLEQTLRFQLGKFGENDPRFAEERIARGGDDGKAY